jgi:hypothetical protein
MEFAMGIEQYEAVSRRGGGDVPGLFEYRLSPVAGEAYRQRGFWCLAL